MAVIDLKNVTIKITDGRQGTLVVTSVGGINSQLTFTDKSTHRGSRLVNVTLVNPGAATQPLTVTVTPNTFDIVISLATDAGSLLISTANQVKAAVDADPVASTIVSVVVGGTGAGVVDAHAKTALANGPHSITVKLGSGNLTFNEKRPRDYIKDRGILSSVRDGDQMPLEVRLDFIWEFIKGDGSGTPTVVDALKNIGDAAAWITTDPDTCAPYCVDVELFNDVPCGTVLDEYVTFQLFRYEELQFDPKANSINVTGKCNTTQAFVLRSAQ